MASFCFVQLDNSFFIGSLLNNIYNRSKCGGCKWYLLRITKVASKYFLYRVRIHLMSFVLIRIRLDILEVLLVLGLELAQYHIDEGHLGKMAKEPMHLLRSSKVFHDFMNFSENVASFSSKYLPYFQLIYSQKLACAGLN